MVSSSRFRALALGLEGAVAGAHMGHPDFRIHGKVFASLRTDGATGALKLTPEEQQRFMADVPAAFSPAAGAWGVQGWTVVHLQAVDEETLGEALTAASRTIAAKPSRPGTTRATAVAPSRVSAPRSAATRSPARPRARLAPGARSADTGTDAVDAYLAAAREEVRPILARIRSMVRKAAPRATEAISYRMPAFLIDGSAFIYYAPFSHHIGIYPPVKGDAQLRADLQPYAGPKGNLRFPLDAAMPYALIGRVVKARLREHQAARSAKRPRGARP